MKVGNTQDCQAVTGTFLRTGSFSQTAKVDLPWIAFKRQSPSLTSTFKTLFKLLVSLMEVINQLSISGIWCVRTPSVPPDVPGQPKS